MALVFVPDIAPAIAPAIAPDIFAVEQQTTTGDELDFRLSQLSTALRKRPQIMLEGLWPLLLPPLFLALSTQNIFSGSYLA